MDRINRAVHERVGSDEVDGLVGEVLGGADPWSEGSSWALTARTDQEFTSEFIISYRSAALTPGSHWTRERRHVSAGKICSCRMFAQQCTAAVYSNDNDAIDFSDLKVNFFYRPSGNCCKTFSVSSLSHWLVSDTQNPPLVLASRSHHCDTRYRHS